MTPHSLADLFMRQLRKLEDIELQHCAVLPLLAAGATAPELRDFLALHIEETRRQVVRLQEIFHQLGIEQSCEPCATMEGLVAECEELVSGTAPGPVRDAALIAAAQCIEHHEIAAYGTARTFARRLGFSDIPELLQQSLTEEVEADRELTCLAEGSLFQMGLNQLANA
ncbi:MAG: DUF892 family protein [Verrucomicrobium sp.]|nr:DUF892 family protein [Verrucomicrobium sp.]